MSPAPCPALGWQIDGIRGTAEALGARGVIFVRDREPLQDRQGIGTSPGGSRVAWVQDPNGNTLSMAGRREA